MVLKRKRIHVLIGYAISVGAFAQTASVAVAQQTAERVTITGSSIKRVLEEQALPVQIISREEIASYGAANVEALVNSISAINTAGGLTRSMGAGISSYGQSAVSMRGLGSERTLVLVDGRRLAPFGLDSQAVDINAIPMDAIERIEVLTDGASSIYGSDAMAGVINFIMRKGFEGIELNANVGSPSRNGGGQSDKYSIVLGKGSLARDKFNFMLTAGVESQKALKAVDREFSKSGNVPPFYSNGATGGGNIEGVWVPGQTRAQNLQSATNPLGLSSRYYGNPLADSVACNQDGHFLVPGPSAPSTSRGRCFFDSAPYVNLIPKSDKKNLLGTFSIQLDPQNEFYGGWSWVNNRTLLAYQPSPVRASFLATDTAFTGSGVDAALLIRPTNPNYPTAWLNSVGLGGMVGQTLAVTQRAFIAGNRTQLDTSTQTRFNLGLKGNVGGWDYDTAIIRDQSNVKGGVIDGYFSQLGLATALNDPASTWNPWAPGGVQSAAVTAGVNAAKYIGPTAGGTFTRTGWDGRISNTVGKLAGGDIALSLGLDLRREQFEVTAPAILESGDIAGLGGGTAPMSASRQIRSMFGEVNLPILRNLEANVSARQDRYSDLAKDAQPITGKASVRWAPVNMVALRASYGTGFRAPSLSELKTPTTLGTTEQFNDLIAGPDYQANALNGGNPTLTPEESKQKSIGVIFTPRKNLSMRADYFAIEVDKYITSASASALVTAARAGQTGFVTFNPDGSPNVIDQRSINAGLAKFAGFDLGLNWSDKFSFGQIGVDYTGTKMTKAQLTTPDGTEDGLGKMIDDAGNTLKLIGNGGVILKYKHKINVNWAMGAWGLTLSQNYSDKYRDSNDLNGDAHYVPAYSIYDIQARYNMKFMKNNSLKLAVGIKNMFDKNPPIYINATNFFQYGFDPTLYDPLARLFYAKATLNF